MFECTCFLRRVQACPKTSGTVGAQAMRRAKCRARRGAGEGGSKRSGEERAGAEEVEGHCA
eukprot:8725879-Pyramimonas_sp.AAC.1